jgi:archaemetzincin
VKAVYTVALGAIEDDIMAAVEEGLLNAYGIAVRRMPAMDDPTHAFDLQRNQFSSAHILRQLVNRVPADAMTMLAVTNRDLFIPMLSFVLGQAQLNGPAAVVSTARLEQEFYGLPPDHQLVIERVMKEAVHETGHTLGLTHCADNTCPMSLSNNVLHVDIKGVVLCKNCALLADERTNLPRPPGVPSGGAAMRRL